MFGYIDPDDNIIITNPLVINNDVYTDSFLRGMSEADRIARSIYTVRAEQYDETRNRLINYEYVRIDNEIVGIPNLIVITDDELKRIDDSKARLEAMVELSKLDQFLSRCSEDLMQILNVDITNLPQIQQDRLVRKTELRKIIADTEYLRIPQL